MSRGLVTALSNAFDGRVVRPVVFVELQFDSPTGTLYVHTDIGDITADDWDGTSRTWQGTGDLGGIEAIEEGQDISPFSATLVLSGIDSTISQQVLTDDSVLRDVRILIGALDDDRALVSDPHPWWSGTLDDLQVRVGAENVIRAVCESSLIAFQRSNGSLFNDAAQQARFDGDLGFQYLEQVLDARIVWGGDVKSYRAGLVSGGSGIGSPFTGAGAFGGFGGFGGFDTR